MTRSSLAACCMAASLLTVPAAAQKPSESRVVLVGCVLPGVDPDSFVLTGFIQGDPRTHPGDPSPTLYWLSTTKGLKENINRQVEIIGTLGDTRDSEPATVKVEADPSKMSGATLEIKTGTQTVKTAPDAAVGTSGQIATAGRPVGTGGYKEVVQVKKPVRELKVQSVLRVAQACPASGS